MSEIVHMISGEVMPLARFVSNVRTRCGRSIDRPMIDGGPARYRLTAHNGNVFKCTLDARVVSCSKCLSTMATRKKELAS